MKVMLRMNDAGTLVVYVAKKDLEEEVVKETDSEAGKILTLANGWELEFSEFPDKSRLPLTVEAKRLS
ncbi:MAG: putative nitrogen fixation protein NifT [Anabaena sp. CoA2_C59]|jgi:nitrogen fixation protein NifT|uniref:Nitrogen fixation protein FixT n=1 Tax=Aphanizomenon flos-aquae LD13 TaxID=1710894 RepID=A0A1B7VWR4_APHFL|nr:putative nitrogen fixation protein NifT [Aphanizomenon flos-aquae Clear-A1]MBO1043285.1 putative nitrogen fixation protein NifT [Aphanizomenon flos-aquae UKL13-PB]MBO1062619.1 putative nitrogen fixation protein NifT [Aphanizomenon flos-aquae CP01]MCE2907058.1 putative nitrogen fixation protein NifT [Anabaena sp. CoA2_C59]MDJ0507622.1 putative nitrogen fixation protein NifT [Nostocales cyanobacterium LE14-WE12]OBQ25404.1 MAG: nitrogen fixation protein FixT [Aphanizomenon flos-aquae LD13]OBQ